MKNSIRFRNAVRVIPEIIVFIVGRCFSGRNEGQADFADGGFWFERDRGKKCRHVSYSFWGRKAMKIARSASRGMARLGYACLLLSAPAFAACHAVSPSGAGSHTGADWNNSFAGIPGTLTRGDIYYLADGSYGSYSFSQSGTTVVELRKAQSYDNGSSCGTSIAAGWNTGTMGSGQAVFATYRQLAITGAGLLINGNGQQGSAGCGGAVGSNPALPPATPSDCGIKIDNSACTTTCTDGISDNAALSGGFTLQDVEIFGMGNATAEGFMIRADGSTGTVLNHIYMHHFGSVGAVVGGTSGFTMTNSYIFRNQIVAGGNPNHGQFLQTGGDSGGMVVSGNVFRDLGGTSIIISWVGSGAVEAGPYKFFSNIIWTTPGFTPLFPSANGILACINGFTCNNVFLMQNTIGLMGSAQVAIDSETGGTYTVENNLWYQSTGNANLAPHGTFTQDHNSYLVSGTSCPTGTSNACDNASANPFNAATTGDFTLANDAANWNNRASLSSPFNTDAAGVTFTTDRGAFQFVSSSQAAAPACTPGTGTYSSTQTVTCTNPNTGTTVMCYTTNGGTPATNGSGSACSNGTQYTTTISVSASETLNIVAGTSLLTDSTVTSYVYTISTQAATPTLTPGTGTYNSNQTVTLSTSSTGTVIICWATGATTPVTNGSGTGCSTGTSAANNSTITVSTSETVNAVAGTSTTTDSAQASAVYTLVVATPIFTPAAGSYSSSQSVAITSTTGSTVLHYAVNATPTCSSTTYSTPVTVSVSETLEAIGCLSGYSNSSIASAAYIIGGIVHITGACSKAINETGASGSWTASCTPANTNDAIPIFVQCHPTSGTITAITLTAPGWTINQIVAPASTGSNSWGSVFGAIAPNTSAATFTATFTGASNCTNFAIFLSDEFSGNNTTGSTTTFNASGSNSGAASTCNQTAANVTPPLNSEAIWFACLLGSATTATSPYTLGAADGNGNSAEYNILSGNSGVAKTPAYNGSSGAYIIEGVAIAPNFAPQPPTAISGAVLTGVIAH
jgi:chitobiase/beta-hexosaminidase-like protein